MAQGVIADSHACVVVLVFSYLREGAGAVIV